MINKMKTSIWDKYTFIGSRSYFCASFARSADGGGISLASNWQIMEDKRNFHYVLCNYINRGLVFADPRRPDLIQLYLREMQRKNNIILNNHQSSNSHNAYNSSGFLAPPTSFVPESIAVSVNNRVKFAGYYFLRIENCDFFISSSEADFIDLSDIFYKENQSKETKRPNYKGYFTKGLNRRFYKMDFTLIQPGDLVNGIEAIVSVLRTYFICFDEKLPMHTLDMSEVYCIDGNMRSVLSCQVELVSPNPYKPNLRFLKDGRVLLDDELSEPSLLELNEEWWEERVMEEEIYARSKREDRFINLKLRLELQLDNMDRQTSNTDTNWDVFPKGGDYARDLEHIGRYRTGLYDGYGDVWLDRKVEDHCRFVQQKERGKRLLEMVNSKDQIGEMTKTINGSQIHFYDKALDNNVIEGRKKSNKIIEKLAKNSEETSEIESDDAYSCNEFSN
jgi:hypothetical protein